MALKYCCVFEPVSTVQPGACLDPSATIHLRYWGTLGDGQYDTCANHHSIQFNIICIALFTKQSLQSSFTGNYVSTIDLNMSET